MKGLFTNAVRRTLVNNLFQQARPLAIAPTSSLFSLTHTFSSLSTHTVSARMFATTPVAKAQVDTVSTPPKGKNRRGSKKRAAKLAAGVAEAQVEGATPIAAAQGDGVMPSKIIDSNKQSKKKVKKMFDRQWLKRKINHVTIKTMPYEELERCFLSRKRTLGYMRNRTASLKTKNRRIASAVQTKLKIQRLVKERDICQVQMHVRRMKEPINAITAADVATTIKIWQGKKPRQRYALVGAKEATSMWKGKRNQQKQKQYALSKAAQNA